VGALYARQPDDLNSVYSECKKMAQELSSIKSKIFDLTLPMTSVFSGYMFNRGIRKRLGKIRIQDLVLNFFCVSVDLQKQKEVVFRKGLLWKYVRASMSMTGYLPPIAEDGQLLVDGAYMNSVPADVMRHQMGARIVIAIDTSQELERDHYMWGNHLSGWWVLWNSLNPFSKTVRVPSIGDLSDMVRFGLYVLLRKLMAEYSLTQFRILILYDSFVGYLRIDNDETANCVAIFT
jgi:lysophospholipid hydrolase